MDQTTRTILGLKEQLAASRAKCAALRGALDTIGNHCCEYDPDHLNLSYIAAAEIIFALRKHAKEALSASSGEALAAVRAAMKAILQWKTQVELHGGDYLPEHFGSLQAALAELRRVFGDV